jgi:hypothetical protein
MTAQGERAYDDLGPVLPPRAVVHGRAREIETLARIAADCSISGPQCDLPRATQLLRRIGALAGDGVGGEGVA